MIKTKYIAQSVACFILFLVQHGCQSSPMRQNENGRNQNASAEKSKPIGAAPDSSKQKPATVILTLTARLQGKILSIEGTTDLPNGALIPYEYQHKTDYSPSFIKEGTATVTNGKYQARVDLKGWPAGEVEVWAAFQTQLGDAKQPAEVIARFGEQGEKMQGANVTASGNLKRVEVTKTVILRH